MVLAEADGAAADWSVDGVVLAEAAPAAGAVVVVVVVVWVALWSEPVAGAAAPDAEAEGIVLALEDAVWSLEAAAAPLFW